MKPRRFICWLIGHRWEFRYLITKPEYGGRSYPYRSCTRCDWWEA